MNNNSLTSGNTIRETQVQTQIQNVNKDLLELEHLVSQFRERLDSVTHSRPEEGGIGSPPEPQLVPLADAIRDESNRIRVVNTSLRSLLESIEL